MVPYGRTLKAMREARRLSVPEMVHLLGLAVDDASVFHYVKIEEGFVEPDSFIKEAFLQVFGKPLGCVAWALFGRVDSLPKAIQKSAKALTDIWVDETHALMGDPNFKPTRDPVTVPIPGVEGLIDGDAPVTGSAIGEDAPA